MTSMDLVTPEDERTLLAHADRMESAKVEAKYHAERLSARLEVQDRVREQEGQEAKCRVLRDQLVGYKSTLSAENKIGRVLDIRPDSKTVIVQHWRQVGREELQATTTLECIPWSSVEGPLESARAPKLVAHTVYDAVQRRGVSDIRSPYARGLIQTELDKRADTICRSTSMVSLMKGSLHYLKPSDIAHCTDLVEVLGLKSVEQLFALLNGARDDRVYLLPATNFSTSSCSSSISPFSECVYRSCPGGSGFAAYLVMETPTEEQGKTPQMMRLCGGICEHCAQWTQQVFARALSLQLAEQLLIAGRIHPYRADRVLYVLAAGRGAGGKLMEHKF